MKTPLGPPNTEGLVPLAIARGSKKGKWIWEAQKLSQKEKRDHLDFQEAMSKADKKGKWKVRWK